MPYFISAGPASETEEKEFNEAWNAGLRAFTEETRALNRLRRLGHGHFHELARRSGLSRSTVSGVLQGKRGASLETLRKLSEASGVELGKLVEYVESQQKRKGRSK